MPTTSRTCPPPPSATRGRPGQPVRLHQRRHERPVGPLHGGANESVIKTLERIAADGGDVAKWVAKAKDPNDQFKAPGFGHPVYRNFDPRAKLIKATADGSARWAPTRSTVRHRQAAGGHGAERLVLRRAQAVPQRRFLRPHLPRHRLPEEHVHRAVRHGPAARLDRAVEGDDRRPRDEDRRRARCTASAAHDFVPIESRQAGRRPPPCASPSSGARPPSRTGRACAGYLVEGGGRGHGRHRSGDRRPAPAPVQPV